MPRGPTELQRLELEERGYTRVDEGQLCEPAVFERLASAARRVVAAVRGAPDTVRELNGGFVLRDLDPEARELNDDDAGQTRAGAWGVRGVLAPGWGEPAFGEYLASEPVREWASALLGCGAEGFMLPDADALVFCNPTGVDRTQPWHRDVRWWGWSSGAFEGSRLTNGRTGAAALGTDPDFSLAAESERWGELQAGPRGVWAKGAPRVSGHNDYLANEGGAYLRWELALEEQSTGLEIVPGSHRRFRSAFAHDCLLPGWAKALGIGERCGGTPTAMSEGWHSGESLMPGAEFVRLRRGEAVVWNGDCLHRGRTLAGVERLTLSCSLSRWVGASASPPATVDATVRWKLDPAVREALPVPWLRRAWDRWLVTQLSPRHIAERFPGMMPTVGDGDCVPGGSGDALSSWEGVRREFRERED